MQAIRKISTHTPHAGRDKLERFFHVVVDISTHTPLARRDMYTLSLYRERTISTHTPLARRDLYDPSRAIIMANFYSHASCEARQGQ